MVENQPLNNRETRTRSHWKRGDMAAWLDRNDDRKGCHISL